MCELTGISVFKRDNCLNNNPFELHCWQAQIQISLFILLRLFHVNFVLKSEWNHKKLDNSLNILVLKNSSFFHVCFVVESAP